MFYFTTITFFETSQKKIKWGSRVQMMVVRCQRAFAAQTAVALPDSSAIWWQIYSVSHMKQKTLIEIPPFQLYSELSVRKKSFVGT
jgi:hypothetical protein